MNEAMNAVREFVSMDGNAIFVWSSLGMCALVMAAEVLWLRARHTALALEGHSAVEGQT